MVVFPAPVGPTIAIFCPGLILAVKFLIVGLSFPSYLNSTLLNSISPLTFFKMFLILLSSFISFSSINANTLSDAAAADCIDVSPWAIWVSGWVNNLTYVIKATITPNVIISFIVRRAPTIHTATYPKFPINIIIGCIRPDINWLFLLLSHTLWLYLSNFLSASSFPLYAFTTFKPE